MSTENIFALVGLGTALGLLWVWWLATRSPLFDCAWRTDGRPAAYAEPEYAYLNSSARPEASRVRKAVAGWFRRYPRRHRERFSRRFCANDTTSHLSSFFELYLHEVCRRLGHTSEILESDDSDVKRPDFLMSDEDGFFFLEATLATEAALLPSSTVRVMDDFIDGLNARVTSPNFFVHVHESGWPRSAAPLVKCAVELETWLSGLDPDEVTETHQTLGFGRLPSMDFIHDGWRLHFVAQAWTARSRGKRGLRVIGGRSRGGGPIDRVAAIRSSLKKKANRYGDLKGPYVVAVNVATSTS